MDIQPIKQLSQGIKLHYWQDLKMVIHHLPTTQVLMPRLKEGWVKGMVHGAKCKYTFRHFHL